MNTHRRTATLVGVLFIVGTAAGVLSLALTGPIRDAPDFLARAAADPGRMTVGALLVMLMGVTCAGIGVALYPVLRKHNEGLALGAAGFRLVEGAFDLACAIGMLLLMETGRLFTAAGAADRPYFMALGVLVRAGTDWLGQVAVILAWCVAAAMYYCLFYRHRLLPRWLAGWGLGGITLTILATLLLLFRVLNSASPLHTALNVPVAVQEMVMAAWLIVKGFQPSGFELSAAAHQEAASRV
jgi:hypothetical protein